MADEGSLLEMTELVMMEKELNDKLEAIRPHLEHHRPRLAKAKEVILKAKAKYDEIKAVLEPYESERIMIEGELAQLEDKKRQCRIQSRLLEGGIRPGTQAFVDQMHALVGDPEEARAKEAADALDIEAQLAALKTEQSGTSED